MKMNLNSPLFDKIRIKPRAEAVKNTKKAPPPQCEHEGCNKPGPYRAPKNRQDEQAFYSFCIDHVREYNQSYNYFSGMNDQTAYSYAQNAAIGERPTWSLGARGGAHTTNSKLDTATILRARLERLQRIRKEAGQQRPKLGQAALRALGVLSLDENADAKAIRSRFKDSAKRYHPDLNGGDRSQEGRLQAIIDAHNYLKKNGLA